MIPIIISLPERLNDRLIPLKDYLYKEGVQFVVVEAIKKDNGAQGLIETMKKVYEMCLQSDQDRFLILEDDVNFVIDKPFELIDKIALQLPKDFDLMYCGCNLFQDSVELYTPNLIKVFGAWASHCILYSRKGIEKALKAILFENNTPLDTLLVENVQVDGRCFCSFNLMCTQINGFSNIVGSDVNYDKLLIERFKEKTKHL